MILKGSAYIYDHLPKVDGYNTPVDDENSAIGETVYQEPKFW